MKKILILFLAVIAFNLNAQVTATDVFKVVDGNNLKTATAAEIKTFVGAPSFGAANEIVVTNDAGTALENAAMSVGTAGTDFAIDATGAAIVLNLPDASATNRGAITTGSQTLAGLKVFSQGSAHTGQAAVEAAQFNGVVGHKNSAVSAAATLDGTSNTIVLDASSAFTVTLPAAATAGEWVYTFTIVTGTNAITLDPNGAETFLDGASTKTLTGVGNTVQISSNGSGWFIRNY